MRPLAVLIGIVMGSAVSLAVGLLLTWITLLFLPEYAAQLAQERAPLGEAISIFSLISAAAGVSFYAEIRTRSWRFIAHAVTVALLGLAVWLYWPR
jgi:ABC-type Mn2+/Zn2+ transport system permease subunit